MRHGSLGRTDSAVNATSAASTAPTLSGHFEAFAAAVESLIGLSETGIELGIVGTGEVVPHDPWDARTGPGSHAT